MLRLMGLAGLTALIVATVFLFVPPISQDPAYHVLADTRLVLGVPRFGDVVSNLPFVLVGLAGLVVLWRREADLSDAAALPLAAFFLGLALVGPASAYYHWYPTTETLFWDRLPMAVAFMALLAAVLADRLPLSRVAARWGLALLLALGVASVVGWSQGEARGAGDLRAYAIVQFFPVVLIPLLLWLFPRADPLIPGRAVLAAFLLYGLSKGAEALDHEIFALLRGAISGHSLKHLLAAAAAVPLVATLYRGAGRAGRRQVAGGGRLLSPE